MQRVGLSRSRLEGNWLHPGQILIREVGRRRGFSGRQPIFLLGNKKLLASPAAYLVAVTSSFFPGLKSTTPTPIGA